MGVIILANKKFVCNNGEVLVNWIECEIFLTKDKKILCRKAGQWRVVVGAKCKE